MNLSTSNRVIPIREQLTLTNKWTIDTYFQSLVLADMLIKVSNVQLTVSSDLIKFMLRLEFTEFIIST